MFRANLEQMFATKEEQDRVIKSIENDLGDVTPYQRKQFERTIEHLKSDISANLQLVLVPATFGMAEGIEDQSKIFPPPAGADANPGISAAMCLQYPVSRGSVHIKSAGKPVTPVNLPSIVLTTSNRSFRTPRRRPSLPQAPI